MPTRSNLEPHDDTGTDPAISPEAAIPRNPENGQALQDRSLREGEPAELSGGGADSARHTRDQTPNS